MRGFVCQDLDFLSNSFVSADFFCTMGVQRKSTQGSARPKEPVAEKLKCADSLDELSSSTRLRARESAEDRRQRLKRRDTEE